MKRNKQKFAIFGCSLLRAILFVWMAFAVIIFLDGIAIYASDKTSEGIVHAIGALGILAVMIIAFWATTKAKKRLTSGSEIYPEVNSVEDQKFKI